MTDTEPVQDLPQEPTIEFIANIRHGKTRNENFFQSFIIFFLFPSTSLCSTLILRFYHIHSVEEKNDIDDESQVQGEFLNGPDVPGQEILKM